MMMTGQQIAEAIDKLQIQLEAAEDRAEALEQERDELKKDNATLRNRLDLITDAIACGLEQTTLPQDDDEAHAWVENQVRKLRTQLECKWVLGEKLKPGDKVTMGDPLIFVDNGVLHPTLANNDEEMHESALKHTDWYRDPRPLPTLPEPEPVPEVPKWLGCVKCKESGDFLFVTDIKNKTLTGIASNRLGYYSTPISFYELYNHPEVTNSAELVAALKGAKDE